MPRIASHVTERYNIMIKTLYQDPLPYLLIEDFFEPQHLEIIQPEIDYLWHRLQTDREETPRTTFSYDDREAVGMPHQYNDGQAHGHNGQMGARKAGIFIQMLFHNEKLSLLSSMIKNRLLRHVGEFQTHWLEHSVIKFVEKDRFNGLVNFYQDGDYYLSHFDQCFLTMVYCLWPQGPVFQGGRFSWPELDHSIQLAHNSMVIFPGHQCHEVETVVTDREGPVRVTWTGFII